MRAGVRGAEEYAAVVGCGIPTKSDGTNLSDAPTAGKWPNGGLSPTRRGLKYRA